MNIVILNWQRPLWEEDQEIVKMTGRDEPMWVAIHRCMEAMLGISLYSYLYLKLAKTLCLIISYVFSLTKSKIGEQEGRKDSAVKGGWGKGWGRE
jgi:hypothetical protein